MSDDLVPDDLWVRVAPLLPPRPPRRRRYPSWLPADDRAALRGIVYVLRTGVTWADVPAETIGCSGVTCWRRLRDWTEAGVWPRLHEILLAELRKAGLLDMEDAAVDGSHVRALKGGLTPDLRRSTAGAGAAGRVRALGAMGTALDAAAIWRSMLADVHERTRGRRCSSAARRVVGRVRGFGARGGCTHAAQGFRAAGGPGLLHRTLPQLQYQPERGRSRRQAAARPVRSPAACGGRAVRPNRPGGVRQDMEVRNARRRQPVPAYRRDRAARARSRRARRHRGRGGRPCRRR
ncbi:putative transposase IS4/IS5 family [Actinobacteria bacterium OK006]|nr:putative transposase IS4/IS5 family [Actinobacteria bacterium OK006]